MFTIDDFSLAGTSPGLYTDEEIQNIVSAVMPGGVTTKRVDKIEIALERFLKKIRQNLHVVVCMNYRGRWIYLDLFSFDFFILQKKRKKFLRTAPSVLLPEAIKNPASIIIKNFA
mgnify:CR=1 FL=1